MTRLAPYGQRLSGPVLLSLATFLVLGCAEGPSGAKPFTNATIEGDYAIIDIARGGQPPQAGVGVAHYDGNGTFSGVSIQDVSVPPSRQRMFVQASIAGTYNVKPDGTGTSVLTVDLPGGFQEHIDLVLAITKTATIDETEVADEFTFIPEQLGPRTGTLTTFIATRLPAEGTFSAASLKGRYAFTLVGEGGTLPESGLGVVNYDGAGKLSGTATVNVPSSSSRRKFLTTPFAESYTVNPDGTGTATGPDGRDSAFVITKAAVANGTKVAKEAFFVVRNLDPSTKSLLTSVITKLPD